MKNNVRLVRHVLRASALATLLIGLSLLLYAAPIVSWLSGNTQANEHFAVYLGTALVGFAVTNWLYSNSKSLEYVMPAIYGNLTSLLAAIVIDVGAIIAAELNWFVWAILALHFIFLLAFTYCLVIMRKLSLDSSLSLDN
jgi:hypothetical protein